MQKSTFAQALNKRLRYPSVVVVLFLPQRRSYIYADPRKKVPGGA